MLSLIQTQVVATNHWITEKTFADIVAISQMTPGPIGINCATYTGYEAFIEIGAPQFLCIIGSFTATLAVILPSFFIIHAMAKLYDKFKTNNKFESIMSWLHPAVAGLIASAALIMMFRVNWNNSSILPSFSIVKENFPSSSCWLFFLGAFFLSIKKKIGPIGIIILSGLLGFILY